MNNLKLREYDHDSEDMNTMAIRCCGHLPHRGMVTASFSPNLHWWLIAIFQLADELGHGSHGAVNTPAAGFEQHHGDKPQHRRSQHHAVKTECELGDSRMKQRTVISPIPRQLESPK